MDDDVELELARLREQVAALEAALARRSRELKRLQKLLCYDDLRALDRMLAGLPPLTALDRWHESTELVDCDVDTALADVWREDASPAAHPDDESP
jgi:hypothetical protein